MVTPEWVNAVREQEVELLARLLPPPCRLLELGGGQGRQARLLAARGHRVTSVDLRGAAARAEHPIVEYDGRRLPFTDGAFDAAFSSNVLEHVQDLEALLPELRRVLRPGARSVHLMPTPTWRAWTSLTQPLVYPQVVWHERRRLVPAAWTWAGIRAALAHLARTAVKWVFFVHAPRHGELGTAWSELWHFRRGRWMRELRPLGRVRSVEASGLFYTGNAILGARWGFASRRRWARRLGSACSVYVVDGEPAGGEATDRRPRERAAAASP